MSNNNISPQLEKEIYAERKKEINRHIDGLPITKIENLFNEVITEVKDKSIYKLSDNND